LILSATSIAVLVVLLIFGARVVGSTNSPEPTTLALFKAETCSPQPCWHTIQPGKTTLTNANALLQALPGSTADKFQFCANGSSGDSTGCWRIDTFGSSAIDANAPLAKITFQPPADAFRLVDAVKLFGDPINSMLCYIISPSSGDIGLEIPRPLMVAYIAFKGGIRVVAYNPHDLKSRRLDMSMSVYRLSMQPAYDVFSPRWNGFSQQKRLGCNMG
jgi:hypothetical protein